MNQGFLIPVYNHGETVAALVEKLSIYGLPIILVDDGSDDETKACLAQTAACPLAVLVGHEKNCGKGAAIFTGIDKARKLGLTHVLQIDADGQHDINRAAFFLEQSRLHPREAVCSYPEYDASAPASRKHGRQVANTWAKIVTLSGKLRDVMCGFRVYPVDPVCRIAKHPGLDMRMGFDIEILVRLFWRNVPLSFHPVKVVYPQDGISHFNLLWDNVRISWVFTRLFFGMLLRFPLLISRKLRRP